MFEIHEYFRRKNFSMKMLHGRKTYLFENISFKQKTGKRQTEYFHPLVYLMAAAGAGPMSEAKSVC